MDELKFSQQLHPAEWVQPEQAAHAKEIYSKFRQSWKDDRKPNTTKDKCIVPYEIRLKGVQEFTTDKVFEKFWRKANHFPVMSVIGVIWDRYFNGQPSHPKITMKVRDARLDECAILWEKLWDLACSDSSTRDCFMIALINGLKQGGFDRTNGACDLGITYKSVLDNLTGENPAGGRHIKTHQSYPKKIGDTKTAERGYSIARISSMLDQIYGRKYHTLAAEILNKIRPDIGPFTASDVGKYINERKKLLESPLPPTKKRKLYNKN